MILAGGTDLVGLIVRGLSSLIDSIVYWLLVQTYNLLINISEINIFGQTTLSDIGSRIYTILGVIMLFKLSFSIITYIIDPDKLSDSKNGFQSIVKNIIIMLVLIVATPFVFKYAMALQYVVIQDNTIGRIITGNSGSTNKNAGEDMAVAILSGFIRPNDAISECANIGLNPNNNTACRNALNSIEANLGDTYYQAFAGQYKNEYRYLIDAGKSTTKYSGNGEYAITYHVFLSGLVGGFAAYIFLLFCIDIAVRTVKLAFLELIAPIPIVTYMDNGGKDGVFKKWLKECTGTYISLFVRLAAIQFGIYIISAFIINSSPEICSWNFDANGTTLKSSCQPIGPFAQIFLILGTLSFVQQLPKLIENITGLKLEGGFSLNPKKMFGTGALVGAGIGAVGAGLGSAAGNLYAGAKNLGQNWKANKGIHKLGGAVKDTFGMLGSGVAGGVSGGFRGLYSGTTGKNKDNPFGNISTGIKGAMDARNLRDRRQLAGDGGPGGALRRAGVGLRNAAGITSGADKYEKELAAYDEQLSLYSGIEKFIDGEMAKGKVPMNIAFEWEDEKNNKHTTYDTNVLKQEIERMKNVGADAETIQKVQYAFNDAQKAVRKEMIRQAFDKDNYDADGKWDKKKAGFDENIAAQLRHSVEEMDYHAEKNSSYSGFRDEDGKIASITSASDIGAAWDSVKGNMYGAKDKVKSNEDYKQAMANKKIDKK